MNKSPSFDPPNGKPSTERPDPSRKPIKPRSIHVIINPAAGTEQPVLGILNRVFRDHEVDWETFVTKDAGDARRYARESAAAGVDVVMACGGDGTVTEAASGLRGTNVPLAILPCGTANVMSLELNIPSDLTFAATLAASGNNIVRSVDMGIVNDEDFLLRVAVGMEARMTIDTPREAKTRWGNLAYVFTGLNQLTNPTAARYILKLDGLHVEVEGISLMIANSVNVGLPGIKVVQDASISDGLLDVILIRRSDLPSLMAIATNMLLNITEEPEPMVRWRVKNVQVDCEPQQPVQSDGEEIAPTPLTAHVLPKAVQIISPSE